jgi:AcrR family transcriptional regulator
MAQVLKDEVRERIELAALEIFAARGFGGATMGDIAAAAEVSTGNVYRYFATKDALFRAVIPAEVATRMLDLVRQRVSSADGVRDLDALPAAAPWRVASEVLLAYTIEHRAQAVVLLDAERTAGTPHQGFSERLVGELCKLALLWARSVRAGWSPSASDRFVLERIYRGFVATMADVLQAYTTEAAIRRAVQRFTGYHLAGLRAFFEAAP